MLERYIKTDKENVIIKIPKDTLVFAVTHSPYADSLVLDEYGSYDDSRIKILDRDVLVEDILSSLVREKEDGSSLLTDALDKSFEYLIEYSYSDGIEINGE